MLIYTTMLKNHAYAGRVKGTTYELTAPEARTAIAFGYAREATDIEIENYRASLITKVEALRGAMNTKSFRQPTLNPATDKKQFEDS